MPPRRSSATTASQSQAPRGLGSLATSVATDSGLGSGAVVSTSGAGTARVATSGAGAEDGLDAAAGTAARGDASARATGTARAADTARGALSPEPGAKASMRKSVMQNPENSSGA